MRKKNISVGIDRDILQYFDNHQKLNRSAFIRGAIRFALQFKEEGHSELQKAFIILNYHVYDDDLSDEKKDLVDKVLNNLSAINRIWKQNHNIDQNSEWKRRKNQNR